MLRLTPVQKRMLEHELRVTEGLSRQQARRRIQEVQKRNDPSLLGRAIYCITGPQTNIQVALTYGATPRQDLVSRAGWACRECGEQAIVQLLDTASHEEVRAAILASHSHCSPFCKATKLEAKIWRPH
jgi:hypothetical protein